MRRRRRRLAGPDASSRRRCASSASRSTTGWTTRTAAARTSTADDAAARIAADRRRRPPRHGGHVRPRRVHRPPRPPGREPVDRPRPGPCGQRRRPRLLHAVAREEAVDQELDEDFGVFELGRPRVCADDELAVLLELDGHARWTARSTRCCSRCRRRAGWSRRSAWTASGPGSPRESFAEPLAERQSDGGDRARAQCCGGPQRPRPLRGRARAAGAARARGRGRRARLPAPRPPGAARAGGRPRAWARDGWSTRCGPTTRRSNAVPGALQPRVPASAATSGRWRTGWSGRRTGTACGSSRSSSTPTPPGGWPPPTRGGPVPVARPGARGVPLAARAGDRLGRARRAAPEARRRRARGTAGARGPRRGRRRRRGRGGVAAP